MRYLITLLLYMSFGFSQYRDIPDIVTKVATSTANWLKLETHPRAVALGGAFVASGRGIGAVSYNPAAIALLCLMDVCCLDLTLPVFIYFILIPVL